LGSPLLPNVVDRDVLALRDRIQQLEFVLLQGLGFRGFKNHFHIDVADGDVLSLRDRIQQLEFVLV